MEKCPNCYQYKFDVVRCVNRNSGKQMSEDSYFNRNTFARYKIILGAVILIIGGGIFFPWTEDYTTKRILISLFFIIAPFYLLGKDIIEGFIPAFIYLFTYFLAGAVEYFYGRGIFVVVPIGAFLLYSGIRWRIIFPKKWKPIYHCWNCNFEMAWEPDDPDTEIQGNGFISEFGKFFREIKDSL